MSQSKLQKAVELVKSQSGKDKNFVIQEIMDALGVTKPNAYVYYTKAKKVIGMPVGTRSSKATTDTQVTQATA